MSQINEGKKAFAAGAVLSSYIRVKQSAADGSVSAAGPNDETIGVTEGPAFAIGDNVTVRLRNFPGTRKVVCASICSIGDRLFGTTLGQVDTLGANGLGTAGAAVGKAEFLATEANATAGGVVEALPLSAGGLGGILFAATADSAGTGTSSLAENAFPTNQFSIPANTLKVGDVLKIKAKVIVTAQHTTDTIATKLYLGALVLVSVAAFDPGTNDEIFIEGTFTVTALGATGKVQGNALFCAGAPGTATAKQASLASSTLDTTAVALVKVTETFSASDPGNTAVLRDLIVELVRQ